MQYQTASCDTAKSVVEDGEHSQELLLEHSAGDAALRYVLKRLKPKIIQALKRLKPPYHGLTWNDVEPALLMVDSVSELKAAMSDPEGFLVQLLAEAVGPVAVRLL